MTKRQFFVIAFRVLAIYLLLNFIGNFSSILATYRRSTLLPGSSTFFSVGMIGLTLVGALFITWLLWKKSEWLMERILAVPILQDVDMSVNNGDESTDETDSIHDPYDSP